MRKMDHFTPKSNKDGDKRSDGYDDNNKKRQSTNHSEE